MRHIAILIRDLREGGAERTVAAIAGGLAERGNRVDVVILDAKGAATARALSRAVRLIVLQARPEPASANGWPDETLWQPWQLSRNRLASIVPSLFTRFAVAAPALLRRGASTRVLRLAAYFEREAPDIVFANMPQAEYAAYFAGRIALTPPAIVPVLHGADAPTSNDRKRRRQVWTESTRFVAVSHAAAEIAEDTLGFDIDNFNVIYNPAGAVPKGDQLARPKHPWFNDDGLPIVLSAGRFVRDKDFGVLIDAFHRARRERPCRLVILGEGRMRGELEKQVRALGLVDHISFPGWVENPSAYMARAALFVLASRREGFGNVLVEAMACGCPVVSTDCPGGPAEILDNRDLLAPVGDPAALARVMLNAMSKPPDKAALRAKAARFSLDRTVDGYENLLATLLAPTLP